MTQERDPLAEDEAELAAAEAAAIGGQPTRELEADSDHDPAMQAVIEGGGGVSEGFELAEAELVEHAEHGPARVETEIHVREEVDRESEEIDPATYGDADEVEATEVTSDPDAGPDDPGAGPGITAER